LWQIPSSPEEIQDKTLDWLFSLPPLSSPLPSSPALDEETTAAAGEGTGAAAVGEGGNAIESSSSSSSSLTRDYEGGLVTSGVNTPEKVSGVGMR